MIFSKFYIVFLPETFGEVVGTSFRCMGCFIRRFYNTASNVPRYFSLPCWWAWLDFVLSTSRCACVGKSTPRSYNHITALWSSLIIAHLRNTIV